MRVVVEPVALARVIRNAGGPQVEGRRIGVVEYWRTDGDSDKRSDSLRHTVMPLARPSILVTSYYDPAATDPVFERLKPVADVRRVLLDGGPTEDDLIDLLPGTHVVVIAGDPITQRVFESSPQLRMIAADGVGVDSVDLTAATRHGVIVNNAPFVHEANGDFTLGLILALVRKIVHTDRCVHDGRWNDRAEFVGSDLGGRTLGLLGFGRAAQAVARRTAGFDVRRLAYCRRPDREAAARLGVELVSFEDLLAGSDILSLHVALTDQTRGMMAAAELAQMKPDAYLINTSRGAVVDEAALIAALHSGHLAGAALDVLDHEPPLPDNPLLAMPNVIVTAHVASDSVDSFRAVMNGVVDDILLLLNDRRPQHVVNPDVFEHERCRRYGMSWGNEDAPKTED